jgi:hypothetical protein
MPPNHPSASPANFFRLHSFEIVHITGCALDEKATNDRHVIKAIPRSVEGKQQGEVALGTLQAGRTDQFALDFGISRTTGFRHTGKSSVWLSGYLTRSYASDFGSDEEYSMDESEEEEDEEESDSESDDEEAPAAVPLSINGVAVTAKVRHCEAFASLFCFATAALAGGGRRGTYVLQPHWLDQQPQLQYAKAMRQQHSAAAEMQKCRNAAAAVASGHSCCCIVSVAAYQCIAGPAYV